MEFIFLIELVIFSQLTLLIFKSVIEKLEIAIPFKNPKILFLLKSIVDRDLHLKPVTFFSPFLIASVIDATQNQFSLSDLLNATGCK